MAHKKAGGSSRNGRDTAGRRLGVAVVLAGSARDPHADLADLTGSHRPSVGAHTGDLGGGQ